MFSNYVHLKEILKKFETWKYWNNSVCIKVDHFPVSVNFWLHRSLGSGIIKKWNNETLNTIIQLYVEKWKTLKLDIAGHFKL